MASRRHARRNSFVDITSDEESMSDSSESESDGQVPVQTTRKQSRRLALRQPNSNPSRSQQSPRTASRHKTNVSYKEQTTDEDEFDEGLDDASPSPSPKRRRLAAPRQPPVPSRPQRPHRSGPAPRQPAAIEHQTQAQWRYSRVDTAKERRPPFFESLPFEIWLQIFEYASYPLFNPSQPRSNENRLWLSAACTVCKALLEPAVTALYKTPPLVTGTSPHVLIDLLSTPQSERSTMINHNVKIKSLEFDANVLAHTAGGLGRFDLHKLVRYLPLLRSIKISNVFDLPANRMLQRPTRWDYPQLLFDTLNDCNVRLRSFEWHQSLFAKHQGLEWMRDVHLTSAFQSLQEVKLSGFESKATKRRNVATGQEPEAEVLLIDPIAALPKLQILEFESCSALNDILFPSLPEGLRSLRINDCENFDADLLSGWLAARGTQLRELVLEHNKSLDIRFLTSLEFSCPQLEHLRIDLNYYNSHRTFMDAKPNYVDLLTPDDVPTWPSTLRTIELMHLRNWTDDAARTFFKSLADSAGTLPDLRLLRLKAILSLGWRERRAFRDEWVNGLERLFLRHPRPPNRHLQTLKGGRAWLDKQHAAEHQAPFSRPPDEDVVFLGAHSSLPTPPSDPSAGKDDSQRTLRPRRSRAHYSESSDSEDEASSSSSLRHTSHHRRGEDGAAGAGAGAGEGTLAASVRAVMDAPPVVHGMCDVVDVTIDNLRPAERQFREGDFLDSEPSDDEEWDPRAGDRGELYDGWAS